MVKQPEHGDVVFGADLESPTRYSVVAELHLLKDCCKDSAEIEDELRALLLASLSSQGGLASLELVDKKIVSMSLNTHKSAADSVIVGGFRTLDSYRKAALDNLRKHLETLSQPARGTIAFYKQKLEEQETENAALRGEMVVLAARLNETMAYARKLAIDAKKSEEFLQKQSEFLRKFPVGFKE
jgi:hypothetical protein